MRSTLVIACLIAVGVAFALPGLGSAAPGSTKVRVRSCELGDQAKERAATFYARMHSVPGTMQMQMRFSLQDSAGDGPAQVIKVPDLMRWRRSRLHVKSFGYAQTVA